MLNCNLLLDSATRFGLKEGTCKFPRDAEKSLFPVSLGCVYTLDYEKV